VNLLLGFEILGWLLVGLAGFQCLPVAIAILYGEAPLPFVYSAATTLIYGLAIALSVRAPDRRMRNRDGFFVVSAAWVLASGFGALPYVFSGALSPVDALFESVAGFTTTGSSVLTAIEASPRALLFWRSLTQWVGGMGIIVFTIAVLPLLGIGGMQLFRAEVPGPVTDKLTPRIAVTARRLWLIYVALTAGAVAALWITGMSFFDAVCHAFTALSTGGFSTRNASIGAFATPAIEWVLIVVMVLAGSNFALHYRLLTGRGRSVLEDVEFRFYLLVLGAAVAAVAWVLIRDGVAPAPVRSAAFQVVSVLTTTGFTTANFDRWPALARFLVVPLLMIGGMAGSTAGGLKSMRVLIGLRALRSFVLRLSHPLAVRPVRYAGRSVGDDVVAGVVIFFLAYFAIAGAAATVVAAYGYDVVTAVTASLTAIGNVGPGLGAVGPSDNFAHFPSAVKLTLSFCMIAGRLEVFTVLVLFEPHFWRR
jgi:trk system potassium uptake protein TrkH